MKLLCELKRIFDSLLLKMKEIEMKEKMTFLVEGDENEKLQKLRIEN
jgi:hypothetical protein